jgi:tetratricopeptide (TPR) repeat protein
LGRRAIHVPLSPLSRGDAERLVTDLVGDIGIDIADQLLDTAEGNPFVIEELVRAVLDADTGAAVSELPSSIESIILARLDRLPPDSRAVLEPAAVLGRQFEQSVLAEMCDDGGNLDAALADLEALDVLQLARRWPEPEHRFRHPLIHETVMRTLLPERRMALHRRAAEVLEARPADEGSQSAALLAWHWTEAGGHDRAVAYQADAGDAAAAVSAFDEAIAHYSAGLELLARQSDTSLTRERARLRIGRGVVRVKIGEAGGDDLRGGIADAVAVGDHGLRLRGLEMLSIVEGLAQGRPDASHAVLDEARSLALEQGEPARAIILTSRLAISLANVLDLDRGADLATEAIERAHALGDEVALARALDAGKLVALTLGDMVSLARVTDELEPILRHRHDAYYLQVVLAESASVAAAAGDWQWALARCDEALSLSTGEAHPYLHLLRASLHGARGQYGEALGWARTAAALAIERDNAQWTAWTAATLGGLLIDVGQLVDAIGQLERGYDAALQGGITSQLARITARLAQASYRMGDHERAGALLDTARTMLPNANVAQGRAYLLAFDAYAATAELMAARSDAEQAVALIHPLVDVARSVGSTEALAHLSRALGTCRAAAGEPEPALEAVGNSLQVATATGLRGAELRALLARGNIRAALGDHEGARADRSATNALADELSRTLRDQSERAAFLAHARNPSP